MKKWGAYLNKKLPSALIMLVLGGVSCFAFAPYNFFFILFISLSLLMRAIDKALTKKKAAWHAFWFGAGLGMTSMSWVTHALMIDGGQFAWVIPFMFIAMGLFFGAFYAMPAALSVYYEKGWRRWLAFGCLYTLFEWVKSWFIFGGFPWNPLGNVWVDVLPVLQAASIVGVYGLSLFGMLLFSSFALYKVATRKMGLIWALFFAICILGWFRLYDAKNDNVWGVKLRLVQPNVSQTLKWDPDQYEKTLSKLIRLSRTDNQKITHVIWPETAVPFAMNTNEYERLRLMAAIRQGSYLITGGIRVVDENRTLANSVFVLDDLTDIQSFYDKAHLVPFGEYAPLRGILPMDKIVPFDEDFYRGSGSKTILVPKAPTASPLVCYEVIFPHAVINAKKRPGWMINVTNDAWFGMSAGPHQHYASAVLRAVEEGIPVVRVANHGVTGVINPYGKTLASMSLGVEGVIDSDLPVALTFTFFSLMGNWIWGILAFIGLCISFKKRK